MGEDVSYSIRLPFRPVGIFQSRHKFRIGSSAIVSHLFGLDAREPSLFRHHL